MNNIGGSLQEMVQSSLAVMRQPSVATFERFERRGNLTLALIYVAIGAVIAGIFGFAISPKGIISNLLGVIVNFLVFTFAVYRIGKSQNGTGSLDEVAYTFALFSVPLQVIGALVTTILFITVIGVFLIPLVLLAMIAAQIYFAYLAVQSSMNLRTRSATWITLGTAALFTFIASMIVTSILT